MLCLNRDNIGKRAALNHMLARISISPLILQTLQFAFLEGAGPVTARLSVSLRNSELFLFGADAKGKTKGSTKPYCFPTACVFAQPCYCRHRIRCLACPLSEQLIHLHPFCVLIVICDFGTLPSGCYQCHEARQLYLLLV